MRLFGFKNVPSTLILQSIRVQRWLSNKQTNKCKRKQKRKGAVLPGEACAAKATVDGRERAGMHRADGVANFL